MMFRADV